MQSRAAILNAKDLERSGHLTQALSVYEGLVRIDPADHEALHHLGLAHFNLGRAREAVEALEKAVAAAPGLPLYHRNLGEVSRRVGNLARAVEAGRRATALSPADLDAHYNLGLALADAGHYAEAVEQYRKALAIDPRHGLSWNNLGSSLGASGRSGEAMQAYLKAIETNPLHAEALCNAGALYIESGDLEKARQCLDTALSVRPDFLEAHHNLAAIKTYVQGDPHLAVLERIQAQRERLAPHLRIKAGFALGKALEDIGQHDRAFEAYQDANSVQHALMPVDEDAADSLVDKIIAVFSHGFFAQRKHWVEARDTACIPVFIVGMPRSGSTLLEQILATHPGVFGAGELKDFAELIDCATSATSVRSFADGAEALTQAQLASLGQAYVERLSAKAQGERHITDKMPGNLFYLGLIHLALPGARIVHAMRDPMDSCFSCYSKLFNDAMPCAYDLQALGRHYQRYARLMKHWHEVLPPGAILDLSYEEMVEDTEAQARRVMAHVGLPWDPACLAFFENKRTIRTASVAQVRKPIYTTSVARWKRFARHLQPLHALVRDHRPADETTAFMDGLPRSPQAVPVRLSSGALAPADKLHAEGVALYRADRFKDALDVLDRALVLRPDSAVAFNSRGYVLQDLGRLHESLADFQRAVELAPDLAIARLNLGMMQLKLGDFVQGWENYEARWTGAAEYQAGQFKKPELSLPVWGGVDEGDSQARYNKAQSLLVITEQGYGDTFQFARYLPVLAARFKRVGFVCSEPTQRLMDWSFGDQIVTMTRLPAADEGWDVQCAMMSLPRALRTTLDSIPGGRAYLTPAPAASRHWAGRVAAAAPRTLRIGIAWAGRAQHHRDSRRSIALPLLHDLLCNDQVTWFSLQKWTPESKRPDVPSGVRWIDWTEQLDFADTAAFVSNLDLVISVDSAMVHLAGALGRPVWMLDRFDNEWRWLSGRDDSPWYPGMRIFRQVHFGDWAPVVQRLDQALRSMAVPRDRAEPEAQRQPASQPEPQAQPLPEPLSVDQAMQKATQFQSAGRLQEADALLRAILQTQPGHGHALHLLGVVAYQQGRAREAIDLIERALASAPNEPLFHCNIAEMSRQLGRLPEAIAHGERAVQLAPSLAVAHSNLGVAYFDAGDNEKAEASHRRALELEPRLANSLNNLGSVARQTKDREAAARWYRQALEANEHYLEAYSNLGAVLVELNRPDEAAEVLEAALKRRPRYAEALCNLGLARLKQDRGAEAENLLRHSLELRPGYPEAAVGLAKALQDKDEFQQSLQLLEQVLARDPGRPDAWFVMGSVLMEMGGAERAEAAFGRALALDADSTDALVGMGNLRLELGKLEDAERLLSRSLQIDPDNIAARFHLAQVRKVRPDDANVAALEAHLLREHELNDDQRISLHYALGKCYDDLKAWDRAFPQFLEGARLKRQKLDFDADEDEARTLRLQAVINAEFIDRMSGGGDPSELPIFVLGMPRSGTTLTEQIIASHPQVHGAGELRELFDVLNRSPGAKQGSFPERLAAIGKDTLGAWGAEYVRRLRSRAPTARRITDKMPANYFALGLIPLMLPNARIIHVTRNPADTCVSCFTRLFNRHQEATYDLTELGRHYANYARLMTHWRTVLPAGSFLEVQYEDIVADMEGQARRLIDWCGLPWDDQCLAFHKHERSIRTASVAQVRQPIYGTSVERWRHYEPYLEPLLQALGPWAPARSP